MAKNWGGMRKPCGAENCHSSATASAPRHASAAMARVVRPELRVYGVRPMPTTAVVMRSPVPDEGDLGEGGDAPHLVPEGGALGDAIVGDPLVPLLEREPQLEP